MFWQRPLFTGLSALLCGGLLIPNSAHAFEEATSMMKKGKKHTDCCNRRHGFMKVMCHTVEKPKLVDLAIFQNQGKVLNAQDHKVARDTEGHLCEHGVNVRVPENKPASERLTFCFSGRFPGVAVDVLPLRTFGNCLRPLLHNPDHLDHREMCPKEARQEKCD